MAFKGSVLYLGFHISQPATWHGSPSCQQSSSRGRQWQRLVTSGSTLIWELHITATSLAKLQLLQVIHPIMLPTQKPHHTLTWQIGGEEVWGGSDGLRVWIYTVKSLPVCGKKWGKKAAVFVSDFLKWFRSFICGCSHLHCAHCMCMCLIER